MSAEEQDQQSSYHGQGNGYADGVTKQESKETLCRGEKMDEEEKQVTEKKVFGVTEIRQVIVREDKEKIIFEKIDDCYWVYHAPNAQNHTGAQV